MQATTNAKRYSQKLHEILGSMDYEISQTQCFDVVNNIEHKWNSESPKKLKGKCLDVISKLEGYTDWNTYTGDISINLNRAEQFVDDMIKGAAENSYEKFHQHFEEQYLVHSSEKNFLKDLRGIRENLGNYISREFLGCITIGQTDPDMAARWPQELRYLWRGVFEKNEVLISACIYCKDGNYHVSGFHFR